MHGTTTSGLGRTLLRSIPAHGSFLCLLLSKASQASQFTPSPITLHVHRAAGWRTNAPSTRAFHCLSAHRSPPYVALVSCETTAWLPHNLGPDSLDSLQRTIHLLHTQTSLLPTKTTNTARQNSKHGPLMALCQRHPAVHTIPHADLAQRTHLSHRTTLSPPAPPVRAPPTPTPKPNPTHAHIHARGCIHAHASEQCPSRQAGITLRLAPRATPQPRNSVCPDVP